MKIGVVTVHDSNNYGSFLQAYALQEILQEMGYEVYFARTRDKKFVKRTFIPRLLEKKYIKHPIQFLNNWRNGILKRNAFILDQSVFKEIDCEELKSMDLVILGSDEIWNIQVSSFQNLIFFGEGLSNTIAYAVSVGRANDQDFIKSSRYMDAMKKIGCIMVRDFRTREIVRNVCGYIPEQVCDPTFLIDRELFRNKQCIDDYHIIGKYLLVYSYSVDKNLEKMIKLFAEQNRLKIVSACFYYKWVDYNIMCGPMEFCNIIQKAEYVITTTFHGTIFSILNEKQFVCIPASIKTNDLLRNLQLEKRILNENACIEQINVKMKVELIDYARVNTDIKKMRDKSAALLKHSIESMVKMSD